MNIFNIFKNKKIEKPSDAILQEIEEILQPHQKLAFYPEVYEGSNHKTLSKFSGMPKLLDSELWPCCENCKEPMQLFIQLDSNELPEEAKRPFGDGFLQVFYCTNSAKECDVECEAYFPFSKSTLVRVLGFDETFSLNTISSKVKKELPQKTITGWRSTPDYPSREELDDLGISLSDEQHDLTYDNNFTSLPKDKLLGWPLWVQGVEYPDCPECGERMSYILQLDSDDNLDFMFGDAGCSHVTQCKTHKNQLTIAWACC